MSEQQAYQPPPASQGQPLNPPPGRPQGVPYRQLTRTTWDAPISGVCGGIARYLGVDPTVVRVVAAVSMIVTFPAGPIAYAVMWAVIPRE